MVKVPCSPPVTSDVRGHGAGGSVTVIKDRLTPFDRQDRLEGE